MTALDPFDLDSESVNVTRDMLVAGLLVGLSGEHDPVPRQEQIDRTADLIMRAGRSRRQALERLLVEVSAEPDGL